MDNQILLSLIQEEKYLHTYKIIQNEDYFYKDQNNKKVLKQKEDFPIKFKDAIPLGLKYNTPIQTFSNFEVNN